MLCHTMPYAFLPFVIAFPALPNGLFRLAEKPVSCLDMVRPAPPYGQSGSAEKPFPSSVVTFSPSVNPKNASPTSLFLLLTPTSSVPSVPLSPFPVVNIFYSLKRINIRFFTARSPRHTFSVVLRRHIIPHPLALKHFPDTPFSAP